MPDYKLGEETYTQQEVADTAARLGVDIDTYITGVPGLEVVEKTDDNVNWFNQTWFGRGFEAASTTGEATDLLMEGSNVNLETVQEFIKAKEEEAKEYVPSERMQRFQKQYQKEGSSWSAFFRGVKRDPALMAELFVQSLGTQVGTAFDSGEARALAASTGIAGAAGGAYLGYGALGTGVVGAMGGLATSMEAALTFGELIETELKKEGKEFTDENIKALLEGPKGKSIRNRSIGRGIAIGTIEALSGGLAVKATTGAARATQRVIKEVGKGGKRSKIAGVAAGTTVEAVGGGTGEVAGRIAADQEMDPAEIGFEAITGTVTAPITVGVGLKSYKKPKYMLNGEEVTYAQMEDFVESGDLVDIANARIKIENDFTGLGKKAKDKNQKAVYKAQIDDKITDEQDINDLVDLGEQLDDAKIDANKKDTAAVPGADVKVKEIEDKIAAIINKYAGAVGFGETTIGKQVQEQVRQNRIMDTIEFAEESGKIIGKDVEAVKDGTASQEQYNKVADELGIKQEDRQDVTESDGWILGDKIVINKDVAGKSGQINVGAHEILHGVLGKHLTSLSTEQKETFISEFTSTISKESRQYIEKEINRRNKKGESLDIKTTDEWLTIYSDGITKKEISFNEGISVKLRNLLQNIFRKFGYNKEFGSGLDTYNFMRDYQKSIKDGKISKRAATVAGGGVTQTDLSQSRTYQDVEGMKAAITSDNQKTKSDAIVMAAARLENEVDRRLPDVEGINREERIDIVRDFMFDGSRGLIGLLSKYNPEVNDSIMGYLNGFVPGTKMSLLDARLQEFYQDNPRFGNIIQSMEQEGVAGKVDASTTSNPVDAILTQKVLDQFKTPLLSGFSFTKKQIKKLRDVVSIIVGTKLPALDAAITGNKTTTPIIAEMKKQLYVKNGKLHKLVYELMGKDRAAIEAFFKNPKFKKAILDSLTTTWLSKYLPMGVEKEVNGIGYTTDHVGRTKGTKEGQINFWRASEEGPYKGMTDGKQKIRRNPNAVKDITPAMLLSAFVKGKTMSDIERAGLENISLAITQELGLETFKADLVNEGPLKKLFEGRQELFERVLDANYVEEFVRQQERGLAKLSESKAPNQKLINAAKKLGKETQYDAIVLSTALGIRPIDLSTREGREEYMAFIIDYVVPALPRSVIESMSGSFARGDSTIEKANSNKFLFQNKDQFKDFLDQLSDLGINFGIENLTEQETTDLQNAFKREGYANVKEKTILEKLKNTVFKESKQKGIERFFKKMQDDMQVDANTIPGYAMLMSSSSRFQGHIMRTGAIIKFWNKLIGKNVEEHTSPVTALGKYLFIHALIGDLFTGRVSIFDKAMKSYFQGSLPKFMDKRLKGVDINGNKYDYTGTPPLELMFDILEGKISIWARYFHPNVNNNFTMEGTEGMLKADIEKYSQIGGLDPNVIILDNENTLAKEFGVDVNVKDQTPGVIAAQQDLIYRIAIGENISAAKIQNVLNGAKNSEIKVTKMAGSLSKSTKKARTVLKYNEQARGMSAFDFDETVGISENFVIATKDGEEIRIASNEWPFVGDKLLSEGWNMDFTDFNRVTDGKPGPLMQKMKNQIKKFGPKNVFILTARAPESQAAIHAYLKSEGINIPLENITGLGNSTGQAKAIWMLEKFAEGYNDMYFVDDALPNVEAVKNVLDQLDIKSKVVQAKLSMSSNLDQNFNVILEEKTGIDRNKRFSAVSGAKAGFKKGKFRFFVPPSHEDFIGLLYNFIGKGKEGNKHRGFFDKSLIRPLNRAYVELNSAKQVMANDYQALIKAYPQIRKLLSKKMPGSDFYYSDAVRVYLWDKFGMKIPNISQEEITELSDMVKKDPELKAFADKLGIISRQDEGYVKPSDTWDIGDINTDLADATGRVGRKQFFEEFIQNADIIFSKDNLNKIEAIYGKDFREALEDMLYRTTNGRGRPTGSNRMVNGFVNWLNASVGATMFLNVRSMLLQQLSNINFINWGDNNLFKASKAFANQKQYWSDFVKLLNSDFLKQRRAGIGFDVNAAELAQTIAKSKEPVRAFIRLLLQKGFTLTQIGDSVAIATGGATMYRNRVNTYLKQDYSLKDAEARAFEDFQEIAEATQQSARQDMISQQQASILGKFILAFQNYGSQVVRIKKKSVLDLINRRMTPPYKSQTQSDVANVSKIIHYAVIQNVLFHGLQTALFAMMFSSDEDDEKAQKDIAKKKGRFLQGMLDTILRGTGIAGGVVTVLKNTAIKWNANQKKDPWTREKNLIFKELLQISPPLGIKERKISGGERNYDWNRNAVENMDLFDIDNPIWPATFSVIEGALNVPLANTYQNVQNIKSATDSELETWKRLHLVGGWSTWDVGVRNERVKEANKKSSKNSNKSKKSSKKKKSIMI